MWYILILDIVLGTRIAHVDVFMENGNASLGLFMRVNSVPQDCLPGILPRGKEGVCSAVSSGGEETRETKETRD